MERELQLGQQKLLFDCEATVVLYRDTFTVADGDRCGCTSCKNFASQRGNIYPGAFLQFLKELGINPLREWEVFDYDFDSGNPNKHLYGGWFLFVGELVAGVGIPPKHATETFTYWFTTSFPAATLPTNMKICAVEFLVQVPWIPIESDEQSPNQVSPQHRSNVAPG
jgi:hypothetical protein